MSIREHILGEWFSWRAGGIKISFESGHFNQSIGALRNFLNFIDCYSYSGKEYQIGVSSLVKAIPTWLSSGSGKRFRNLWD